MKEQLQHIINTKTKPIKALGLLEDVALQIGVIQNTIHPNISNPQIVVFAADHGIATSGLVNQYPQAVTAQMVLNFANGGAAINVFCKQNNIGLTVVDAGVNFDFESALNIIHAKIAKGTGDYSKHLAMSTDEAFAAIEKGKTIVENIILQNKNVNCIGFGEMGIANTSSAALIMHHYLNIPIEDCVGLGTGANNEQLQIKIDTLDDVSRMHELAIYDITPTQLLCKIGGFEIAMMAGAYVKSWQMGLVIVVDGFIATAALLIASKLIEHKDPWATINPNSAIFTNCIFAHVSEEKAHKQMLDYIRVKPLLQLNMRLGEGTGSALAIPLLQSACAFVNEMANFESAGVSTKD